MVKPYDGPILWTYEYSGEDLKLIGLDHYNSTEAKATTPLAKMRDYRRMSRSDSFSLMVGAKSARAIRTEDKEVTTVQAAEEELETLRESFRPLIRDDAVIDEFVHSLNQVMLGDAARNREFENRTLIDSNGNKVPCPIGVNATNNKPFITVKEGGSVVEIRIIGTVTQLNMSTLNNRGQAVASLPIIAAPGQALFTYDTTFEIRPDGDGAKTTVLKHRIAMHDKRVDEACPFLREEAPLSFGARLGNALRGLGHFIRTHKVLSVVIGLLLIGGCVAAAFFAPPIALYAAIAVTGAILCSCVPAATYDNRFSEKLKSSVPRIEGEGYFATTGAEEEKATLLGAGDVPLDHLRTSNYFQPRSNFPTIEIPDASVSGAINSPETHSDRDESEPAEVKRGETKEEDAEGDSSSEEPSPPSSPRSR